MTATSPRPRSRRNAPRGAFSDWGGSVGNTKFMTCDHKCYDSGTAAGCQRRVGVQVAEGARSRRPDGSVPASNRRTVGEACMDGFAAPRRVTERPGAPEDRLPRPADLRVPRPSRRRCESDASGSSKAPTSKVDPTAAALAASLHGAFSRPNGGPDCSTHTPQPGTS
jgi:hypothetical protein